MKLVASGMAVGLQTLTGLQFDPHQPYTACFICGEVFQSNADRNPVEVFRERPRSFDFDSKNVAQYALSLRKNWSKRHAKTHSEVEHFALVLSGRTMTPEAALKLAPLGLIDVVGLVVDDEVSHALRESKPVPINDVEGT